MARVHNTCRSAAPRTLSLGWGLLIVSLLSSALPSAAQGTELMFCNGRADLCNKTLSEVSLVGTHNSFAYPANDFINVPITPIKFANQNKPISEQLADGVRVINLDVWSPSGQLVLCHGICLFGEASFEQACGEIVTFLQGNPNEVVVLLVEDNLPSFPGNLGDLKAGFETCGLAAFTSATGYDPSSPPTLGQMIERGERAVVWYQGPTGCFKPEAHPEYRSCPSDGFLQWMGSAVYRSQYGFDEVGDFAAPQDGGRKQCQQLHDDGQPPPKPAGYLRPLNHFLTNKDNSFEGVNSYGVLADSVWSCWTSWGYPPNYILVDFYEDGEVFDIVNSINDSFESSVDPFNAPPPPCAGGCRSAPPATSSSPTTTSPTSLTISPTAADSPTDDLTTVSPTAADSPTDLTTGSPTAADSPTDSSPPTSSGAGSQTSASVLAIVLAAGTAAMVLTTILG